MTNILIPEDIPSHNKGESALFYGLKESLISFEHVNLTIFSLNPDMDCRNYAGEATVIDARGITPAHMLDAQGGKLAKIFYYFKFIGKHMLFGLLYKCLGSKVATFLPGAVWNAYVNADLVLMSHDSFYTPLYHGTQALLLRLMRKPAMIYAATIKRKDKGKISIKARLLDYWTAYTCKKLTGITLRETFSKSYLLDIGMTDLDPPIAVYPDLAFIMPLIAKEKAQNLLRLEGIPENRTLLGMAVSQRKLDFAFPGQKIPNRPTKALASIIEATNYMVDELDANIVFIPHSIGPTSVLDDRITADMIRDKCRRPDRIYIIRNEYSSQQLKGMAACLDMTIGTRLHFSIDAVCSGVPSLLITHDGDIRCHGIMGKMLGMQDYVYNIDYIEAASLIKAIASLWKNREAVRKHLTELIPKIKNKTYRHGEMASALVKQYHP